MGSFRCMPPMNRMSLGRRRFRTRRSYRGRSPPCDRRRHSRVAPSRRAPDRSPPDSNCRPRKDSRTRRSAPGGWWGRRRYLRTRPAPPGTSRPPPRSSRSALPQRWVGRSTLARSRRETPRASAAAAGAVGNWRPSGNSPLETLEDKPRSVLTCQQRIRKPFLMRSAYEKGTHQNGANKSLHPRHTP